MIAPLAPAPQTVALSPPTTLDSAELNMMATSLFAAADGFALARNAVNAAGSRLSGSWTGAGANAFASSIGGPIDFTFSGIAQALRDAAAALTALSGRILVAYDVRRQAEGAARAVGVLVDTMSVTYDSTDSVQSEAAQSLADAAQQSAIDCEQAAASARDQLTLACSALHMPSISPVRDAVVAVALTQVGYTEQPLGSNIVPRYFSWQPSDPNSGAWCSVFATWTLSSAGIPIPNLPAVRDLASWGSASWEPNTAGATLPQPGDEIIWSGNSHVSIVVATDASGRIATVDGNFNDQVTLRSPMPLSTVTSDDGPISGWISPTSQTSYDFPLPRTTTRGPQ